MDIEKELDDILAQPISDIEKIDAINEYCLTDIDLHTARRYKERTYLCKELLEGLDYPKGRAYNLMAEAYLFMGENRLVEMQAIAETSIALFEKLDEPRGLTTALTVDTYGKLAIGDFSKAFKNAIRAVKLAETMENASSSAWVYYTMGVMYFDIKDFQNSLKYYSRALDRFKPFNHTFGIIRSALGVGSCYLELNQLAEAREHIQMALDLFGENHNGEGISRAINDLGVLHRKEGNLEKSLEFLLSAYDIRKDLTNKRGENTTLIELAETQIECEKFEEAIDHLEKALVLCEKTQAKPKEMRAQYLLYKAYKAINKTDEAFKALERYTLLKDEVSSTETNHRLKLQESNFAAEKAEHVAEIEREKNKELRIAHDEIAEKQQEITDSITYAKRIQKAILPSDKLVKKALPDSFIYYKPKDIVAGDFYWLEITDNEIIFAAADCTGHGVPGAMVSVICNNTLNRTVREFNLVEPGLILDKAREIVIQEFEKSEEDVKDGMDIALCALKKTITESFNQSFVLHYAGAHNPLWIIRKEENEIEEIKANKQPIGLFDQLLPFTTHTVKLQPGDLIYIFTDGFVDQFGGEKGKKFKASNLKELLLSIRNKPMETQSQLLDEAFENWKGTLEQVDDVCIIGVRI